MSYIAFFDLLGTKGFCENSEIYYKNISTFYKSIRILSWLLEPYGSVGVFSDCAYAESTDLRSLLNFLVELRDRFISQGLFFNAIIKKGVLKIQNASNDDNSPISGVVFNSSDIADLYISHSKFKGAGIFIDESIWEDINKIEEYKTIDCIYISKTNDGKGTSYMPVKYKDIAFHEPRYGKKSIIDTLNLFYRAFYSAYVKSPRYGAYYISILTNFLRSYNTGFKWDSEGNTFTEMPIAFMSAYNMITDNRNDLIDLPGLEFIAFIMLDIVFNSKELNEEEKKIITRKFVNLDCIKNKYIHALNEIPDTLFTKEKSSKIDNRELFIRYCQNDLARDFINQIMNNKKPIDTENS